MHPAKAITVAVEIESRIRRGFYTTRLPTTDVLQNEFQAARQTITRALQILSKQGIITTSAPRNGVRISRENLSSGTIAVVVGGNVHKEDLCLIKEIMLDGFEAKMYYSSDKEKFLLERASRFRGILFINSSLTKETASGLLARRIPFVSCNRITFSNDISFIDYDQEQLIRFMIGHLVKQNCQRIAFFYSSGLEGYNEESMRLVRKVKREFGLPILAYDHFTVSKDFSISENFINFMKLSLKKEDLPEILIAKQNFMKELESFSEKYHITYPDSFRFIFHRLKSERIPKQPWVNTFVFSYPTWRLWIQGYKLLRENILVPESYPRHKYVPQKIVIKL